jgi:hypothetical protein
MKMFGIIEFVEDCEGLNAKIKKFFSFSQSISRKEFTYSLNVKANLKEKECHT